MLEVNLERFWHDNDIALKNPFGRDIPQAPMKIDMSYETLFDELGYEFDMRRLERDYEFARSAARAYNDLAEKIVGRRLLDEEAYDPSKRFPRVKSVGEVIGCPRTEDKWSDWLHPAAHNPQELARLIDRMEKMTRDDIRAAMLPEDWDEACRRIYERHGIRPHLGRHLRGPVTLAMSIYGEENLIFLILDDPPLAARFRDALTRIIIEYYKICDEISGVEYGPDGKPVRGGFSVADDNCALLTPDMYEFFGLPILMAIYEQFAPRPGDSRFQHSDSDMGHLLPVLARTGMNCVNFGPNVRFKDIRAAMPHTVVMGTLAPFTLMRNDTEKIIAEVRRDLDEARQTRGLIVAGAGSINNGTRLTSMRAVMYAIENWGRADRGWVPD